MVSAWASHRYSGKAGNLILPQLAVFADLQKHICVSKVTSSAGPVPTPHLTRFFFCPFYHSRIKATKATPSLVFDVLWRREKMGSDRVAAVSLASCRVTPDGPHASWLGSILTLWDA